MQDKWNVPHLKTTLTGPLLALEEICLSKQVAIETFFREAWQKTRAPVYGSVDLRNSGYKVAPVDMNLFPAGFNNLNADSLPLCIQAAYAYIEKNFPACKRILVVPENHTRNLFYWESVYTLQTMLRRAGYEVRVGSIHAEVTESFAVELPSGNVLSVSPITRRGDQLSIGDFVPCMVLLNNDLSDGEPEILKNTGHLILPPASLGWHQRLKSSHFRHYDSVVDEFSRVIDVDPWLLNPLHASSDAVDFMQREGEADLVAKTEALFSRIREKYAEYNIKEAPYVVVKAESGTYGMGVMTIKDSKELVELNRKARTKMSTTKGGQAVRRVLLQEGVYTFEHWQGAVCEPVVYMIGQYVIGGFYRVHKDKAHDDNLNAPGMQFEPLAFAKTCNNPCTEAGQNRFYLYGVVARLSLLAAAKEYQDYA